MSQTKGQYDKIIYCNYIYIFILSSIPIPPRKVFLGVVNIKVFSYECSLNKEILKELIGEFESLLGAVNFPP